MLLKIGNVLCRCFWRVVVSVWCVWLCMQRQNKAGAIPRAPNHYWGSEKSWQCLKYFFQYSTFASEIPQVRTWGRQTCFLPQEPSSLVTPLYACFIWMCLKDCEINIILNQYRNIDLYYCISLEPQQFFKRVFYLKQIIVTTGGPLQLGSPGQLPPFLPP